MWQLNEIIHLTGLHELHLGRLFGKEWILLPAEDKETHPLGGIITVFLNVRDEGRAFQKQGTLERNARGKDNREHPQG